MNKKTEFFKIQQNNELNNYCFDCFEKNPNWVSINNAIYLCLSCAGKHRSLGINIMNKTLDINANYGNEVNNILNEFYSNSKKNIIGGDLKKDNFEDWKLSINEKNAEIINYDNIIKITDLLDEDIKIKLKIPLKIIDEKYEKRKNYYETVNKLKQIKNLN